MLASHPIQVITGLPVLRYVISRHRPPFRYVISGMFGTTATCSIILFDQLLNIENKGQMVLLCSDILKIHTRVVVLELF